MRRGEAEAEERRGEERRPEAPLYLIKLPYSMRLSSKNSFWVCCLPTYLPYLPYLIYEKYEKIFPSFTKVKKEKNKRNLISRLFSKSDRPRARLSFSACTCLGLGFCVFLGLGVVYLKRIARLAPSGSHACCVFWIWWCFEAVVVGDEGVGRGVGGVVWCGVWWCGVCGVCGVGLRSRGERGERASGG